jgi:hypothetical protein
MQAYWLVVRVLLTPPAEAAASQKWKIIYLQVLTLENWRREMARMSRTCTLIVIPIVQAGILFLHVPRAQSAFTRSMSPASGGTNASVASSGRSMTV